MNEMRVLLFSFRRWTISHLFVQFQVLLSSYQFLLLLWTEVVTLAMCSCWFQCIVHHIAARRFFRLNWERIGMQNEASIVVRTTKKLLTAVLIRYVHCTDAGCDSQNLLKEWGKWEVFRHHMAECVAKYTQQCKLLPGQRCSSVYNSGGIYSVCIVQYLFHGIIELDGPYCRRIRPTQKLWTGASCNCPLQQWYVFSEQHLSQTGEHPRCE